MALIVFDVDGTITAAPAQYQELASAMLAAGHRVDVLTGSSSFPVTQQDWDNKANYLNELGMGSSYNNLVVISNKISGGLAKAKANYLQSEGADIYVDNSRQNCEAALAVGVNLVLLPYATQV